MSYNHPWALKRFTSKIAADMPSEMELLTMAKHLFMAAWSSCWLLSWAKKTPAVLQTQWQSSVLRDSGFTEAWMMLSSSDKLRAGNMATLCLTCTECAGKVLTRQGSFLPHRSLLRWRPPAKKLKTKTREQRDRKKKGSWCSSQICILFRLC